MVSIINKHIIFFCSCIYLCSGCTYKAGNRPRDLNYQIKSTINAFYVEKYLYDNCRLTKDDEFVYPMNADLRNYPDIFFYLPDSIHNYGYVIKDNIILDSTIVQSMGLNLSSIYDYKNNKWLYSRDSISGDIIKSFISYYEREVLLRTLQIYKDSIHRDTLFTTPGEEVKVTEMN